MADTKSNRIVMAFDHHDPLNTYIIKNCTNEDVKQMKHHDLDYVDLKVTSPYVLCRHSDESPSLWNIRFKTLDEIKQYLWRVWEPIFKTIQPGETDVCIEDVEFDELYTCLSFWYAEKIDSPEEIYKRFVEFFENTTIDGDSSEAWVLLDVENNKVAWDGGMNIIYHDSMADFFNRYED